ncbi:MAG: hypothetical protein SGI72_07375 [Planctomycetota bacterium]|nr:hypothetical protein [Planctomycetota bacterium]
MSQTRSFERWWSTIGIVLLVVGMAGIPRQFLSPIDVYDEGLLLTHADSLAHGAVPYRDFYANYPPGVLLLVAGVWKLTGSSVIGVRVLGLIVQALIAWFVGRFAARATHGPNAGTNQLRFSWLACGATFLWLRHGPIWPTAWLAGLLCALISFDLALRARDSSMRWFVVGASFGLVACMRHDLFVYASVLFALVLVAARIAKVPLAYPPRAAIVSLLVGASLPIVLVFGWILAKADWRQPYLDLYRDQVDSMLPGRVLPLPGLWKFDRLAVGVWIGIVAPIVWLAQLWRGRRSLALNALGLLAVAGLPQMLNRTDTHHVVYGLAPGLGVLAIAAQDSLERVRSFSLRIAASLALFVLLAGGLLGVRLRTGREWVPFSVARAQGTPARTKELALARERVVAFVAEHSRATDPIFVGCEQHARVFISEMDLYYLCDRRGGVRRMQFDPNLTNRVDEQEKMIAEMDARHVNVVVLAPYLDPREPNDSRKRDSELFDRWLGEHFEVVERAGPYQLLLRRR